MTPKEIRRKQKDKNRKSRIKLGFRAVGINLNTAAQETEQSFATLDEARKYASKMMRRRMFMTRVYDGKGELCYTTGSF